MNTEELLSNPIRRSGVVSKDAISGTYEVSSAYEIIQIGSMRSSRWLIILFAISIYFLMHFYIGCLNK